MSDRNQTQRITSDRPTLRRAGAAITLSILAGLVGPARAADAAAPAAADHVEMRYPNGLQLLAASRPAAGAVLMAVAVQAGSEDEPADRTGLSHFLEHLLFDGYDALDERAITERFAARSAYVNAFTRQQSTIYFVLAPRSEAAACAELLVGMLTRSTIPEAAFEKEKRVILEELAKEAATPGTKEQQQLERVLWDGTPWSAPVGGTVDAVQPATREQVLAYYQRYYRPDRMRMLVIGDAPLSELQRLAAPLGALPAVRAAGPQRDDPARWPGWGRWRRADVGSNEATLTAALLLPPSVSPQAGALLADWLAAPDGPLALLGASRAASRAPRAGGDVITLTIVPNAGDTPEVLLRRLIEQLQQHAQAGPDPATIASLSGAARRAQAVVRQRLHYLAVMEGEGFAAARGALAALLDPPEPEPATIATAAREAFGSVAPRLRAVWSAAGETAAAAPLPVVDTFATSRPDASAGRDQAAVRGRSTAASSDPARQSIVLSNGLTLVVSEERGSAMFGLTLLVEGRASREAEHPRGTADLLHRLLGKGTALSDGEALQARLVDAGIELKTADLPTIPFDDYYNLPEHSYVRMEGPAESLEIALQVLAETIKTPRWVAADRAAALTAIGQARRAAAAGLAVAASAARGRIFGPQHPAAATVSGLPTDPEPSEADVDAVLGRWPNGYFAPEHMVLAVVSPRRAGEVRGRVEGLLGDGVAPGTRRAPQRAPFAPPLPVPGPVAMPPENVPQLPLVWGRAAQIPPADAPAVLLALTALSDAMTAEIREQAGMAYRLGAGARALAAGWWWIEASVSTRPENRAAVETLMQELLRRLGAAPPPQASVDRWVATARRGEMLDDLAAVARAARSARLELEGGGAPLAIRSDALARVTPEQIQAAALQYLGPAALLPAY